MQNKRLSHQDVRNLLLSMMYECEDFAGYIADVDADRVRAHTDWNYTRKHDPEHVVSVCYDRARALRDTAAKIMVFYEHSDKKLREEVI